MEDGTYSLVCSDDVQAIHVEKLPLLHGGQSVVKRGGVSTVLVQRGRRHLNASHSPQLPRKNLPASIHKGGPTQHGAEYTILIVRGHTFASTSANVGQLGKTHGESGVWRACRESPLR